MKKENIAILIRLAELGLTKPELSYALNITAAELDQVLLKEPSLSTAINSARDLSDRSIEKALFKKAMGYSYKKVKFYKIKNKVIRKKMTVHVPPDFSSIRFWLINRKADSWHIDDHFKIKILN